MPLFAVVITEQITEKRTYMIDAPDHAEAAKRVARKWISEGERERPNIGPETEVEDRSYEVNGIGHIETFDSSEVEVEE